MKEAHAAATLNLLQEIAQIDQLQLGEAYLRTITEKIGKALDVEYILLGRSTDNISSQIKTDVAWSKSQGFLPNFEYGLSGTPCQYVITGNRVCVHTSGVVSTYPDDPLLEEMKIEGYIGAPIIDQEHHLSGLIVALDTKQIDPIREQEIVAILEFFSSRIALEYFRIEAEAKLIALNEKLEQEIRSRTVKLMEVEKDLRNQERLANLGLLTMGVAHEIKNPLNLIYSSAEIIKLGVEKFIAKSNLANDVVLKAFLDKIQSASSVISKQAAVANTSLESLLKQARAGELRQSVESCDLSILLENSLQFILNNFSTTTIANKVSIHRSLPVTFTSLPAKETLAKAFEIFLDNSIYNLNSKLETEPDFRPELKLEIKMNQDSCDVIIRDNGTGIPENEIEKLGQPFISSKPRGEGTGLGIYLAKIFIENNNGTVSFSSLPGHFTEVKISLKLLPAK